MAAEPDWRVKGICAFTRSIGDCQMKDPAAARPEPKTAPFFLQRALLMPRVNPGSHYRCAKSTYEQLLHTTGGKGA